jgi:hypothetical protein
MTVETDALFRLWTGDRELPSLGTNDGASPIAFQSWHHFKEAFAPELVAQAVQESVVPVLHCLDPFGGSGTTALTCQILGVDCTTIEVNPYLADVIRAKLGFYDADELARLLSAIRRRSRRTSADPRAAFATVPASFIEPGNGDRWLFNTPVAQRLGAILAAIEDLTSDDVQRFFRVILGGMLVDVSNVVVSGKGRRYRRNWRAIAIDGSAVDWLFAQRAETAILEVQRFAVRPPMSPRVIVGDARTADLGEERYELAVFSPPYPNSFDYTDVYNVQLWMLGYLVASSDNVELRNATLSSHVQLKRAYAPPPRGSQRLDEVVGSLSLRREQLWSPWIPDMIGAYFSDLAAIIGNVANRLQEGGTCWMVVGDSQYAGITIPVAEILAELSVDRSWRVDKRSPIRHMKSSAQQGWQEQLAESLLVVHAA